MILYNSITFNVGWSFLVYNRFQGHLNSIDLGIVQTSNYCYLIIWCALILCLQYSTIGLQCIHCLMTLMFIIKRQGGQRSYLSYIKFSSCRSQLYQNKVLYYYMRISPCLQDAINNVSIVAIHLETGNERCNIQKLW